MIDFWDRITSRKFLITITFLGVVYFMATGHDVDELLKIVEVGAGAAVAIIYCLTNAMSKGNQAPAILVQPPTEDSETLAAVREIVNE